PYVLRPGYPPMFQLRCVMDANVMSYVYYITLARFGCQRQYVDNLATAEYREWRKGGLEMTSDLLSVEEGLAFLELKNSTLRDWILKRRTPFVKLGRRVFLRRRDLETLIEQSVVPAGQRK